MTSKVREQDHDQKNHVIIDFFQFFEILGLKFAHKLILRLYKLYKLYKYNQMTNYFSRSDYIIKTALDVILHRFSLKLSLLSAFNTNINASN